MQNKKMSLGLQKSERESSIEKLDQVFCSLTQVLASNLQIYFLTKGKSAGEIYHRKLDQTWDQIKRIGLRIGALDGKATMNPSQQQQKSLITQSEGSSCRALVRTDLKGEDKLCAGIRQHLTALQTSRDWSSMAMLGDILSQREEIVHQLETFMDDPVLEHIWDDEEMSMDQHRDAKRGSQMH